MDHHCSVVNCRNSAEVSCSCNPRTFYCKADHYQHLIEKQGNGSHFPNPIKETNDPNMALILKNIKSLKDQIKQLVSFAAFIIGTVIDNVKNLINQMNINISKILQFKQSTFLSTAQVSEIEKLGNFKIIRKNNQEIQAICHQFFQENFNVSQINHENNISPNIAIQRNFSNDSTQNELRKRIEELEKLNNSLKAEIAQKDNEIAQKDNKIAQKDNEIIQLRLRNSNNSLPNSSTLYPNSTMNTNFVSDASPLIHRNLQQYPSNNFEDKQIYFNYNTIVPNRNLNEELPIPKNPNQYMDIRNIANNNPANSFFIPSQDLGISLPLSQSSRKAPQFYK